MRIARTMAEARAAAAELRAAGTLGLTPTMGALHAGHLSLVRRARRECGAVAASIFVNPTQFGPGEDFAQYPRTFEADCALLEAEGVELVFAPEAAEMYPEGATTFVEVAGISDRLDGQSRPGHFRGVATVVAKLFHIVGPQRAYFGQKDAAQVAVLRRMVRDLNFDVELVVCPIVREADGLAMSSRNRYLSAEDRRHALALSRALRTMEERVAGGEMEPAAVMEAGMTVLAAEADVRMDYLRIVDAETLEDVAEVRGGALMAVAAWVGRDREGRTRLIDNVVVAPR